MLTTCPDLLWALVRKHLKKLSEKENILMTAFRKKKEENAFLPFPLF